MAHKVSSLNIDSHQHFWQYHPRKDDWITHDMKILQHDFMPTQLQNLLEENNIDGCVAVQANQSEDETNFLIELSTKNDFIKGVVGWLNLRNDTIEERLTYFSEFKKVKGFRHIIQSEAEDNFILRPDFCNGIRKLQAYNFTYDILIKPHHLKYVLEFVTLFPNQKFVIDHLAKPDVKSHRIGEWKQDIQKIAAFENVFCKISGMVTEADWENWEPENFTPFLDVVLESFGLNRVMYGSDWPVCLLAASYEQQLTIVKNYLGSFSETEKQKIMGGNAIHFYNL